MIFTTDNARIGRAATTGEYALPVQQMAIILAYASAVPQPLEGTDAADNDLVAALIDRTWHELTLINPDLVDEVRRADSPMDSTWIIRIAQHLTNKEN